MGTTWISGAQRLGDGSIGGAMDTPSLPPRVVWHTTESGTGTAAFNAVAKDLIKKAAEPHILYDPTTDKIGQFGPLNQSARALMNDGSSRTNRTGRVCIQIEVLGRAASPFTKTWKPGSNFKALMAAIRSYGVPDRFPLPLAGSYGGGTRTRSTWLNTAGHYGHCNIPGNDHWDPGKLDTAALFKAAPGGSSSSSASTYTVVKGDTLSSIGKRTGVAWATLATLNGLKSPYTIRPGQKLKLKAPAAKPPAFPGTKYFRVGANNSYVTQLGKQLVKKGYGKHYAVGPGPQWGEADRLNVRDFQRARGWSGSDADGYPGPETWKRLFS